MLKERLQVFLLALFTLFSVSSVYAESALNFEIIPLHYDFLNAEPFSNGENEGLVSYAVLADAAQGDNQLIYDPGGFDLSPSELFVYQTTSGGYYIGQVKNITGAGNTIVLEKPLEGSINAGSTIWNFYRDQFHPNESGYKAVADAALKQLSSENFSGTVNAFIGDSWFDNSTLVPYIESKLGAAQVINKGVGGRTSGNVLEEFDYEFPASAAVQPDYFWILVGTNDYDQGVSATEYIDNLTSIIQKVNALGAKALVFTSSVGQVGVGNNNQLSHQYADNLLALKQQGGGGGGSGVTAVTQGDNLVIEFTPTSPIGNDSHISYIIDIDNNPDTGYQYFLEWDKAGPEYLIQDGLVFKSLDDNVWNWEDQNIAATVISKTKVVVPKSAIGLGNSGPNTVINIGVRIASSDYVTTQAYYPTASQLQKVVINKPGAPQFNIASDSASTTQGAAVTINVLANDTGTGLTIDTVDTPDHGTATIANNEIVYQPNAGFTGTEVFRYHAIDSSGNNAAWANITITVTGSAGGSPEANNDTATVVSGEMVTIDVLANDTGNGIQLAEVDEAWTGSISIVNGKLKYQSDGSFTGEIVVWYGIEDANGNTDWASVTITITESGGGGNSGDFEINNDTATVKAGESVIIDVLANDTGNYLDLCCASGAWTGGLSLVNGKVKYTSDGSFIGDIVLWYDVTDADDHYGWASITISITQ